MFAQKARVLSMRGNTAAQNRMAVRSTQPHTHARYRVLEEGQKISLDSLLPAAGLQVSKTL